MHQWHIQQCNILWQKCAHLCTFLLQKGALLDSCRMHCRICEMGLLAIFFGGEYQQLFNISVKASYKYKHIWHFIFFRKIQHIKLQMIWQIFQVMINIMTNISSNDWYITQSSRGWFFLKSIVFQAKMVNFQACWCPGSCRPQVISKILNENVGYSRSHKTFTQFCCALCYWGNIIIFLADSCYTFTHILQGCFTGTGAIIWLLQYQWSNPEGYG